MNEENLIEENNRLRNAWRSARQRAKTAYGAWRYCQWAIDAQNEEMRKQDDFALYLWNMMSERRKEKESVIRQAGQWKKAYLGQQRQVEDAVEGVIAATSIGHRILNLHIELVLVDAFSDFHHHICAECGADYPCATVVLVEELHRHPAMQIAALITTGKEAAPPWPNASDGEPTA